MADRRLAEHCSNQLLFEVASLFTATPSCCNVVDYFKDSCLIVVGQFKKDGSTFLNMLFERGFWEIVLNCQTSLENFIQAARDERYTFENSSEERLLYNIDLSDYNPVRIEDGLGFTLTLTAEHYYDFCVQQVCTQLEGFLKDLAVYVLARAAELEKEAAGNG